MWHPLRFLRRRRRTDADFAQAPLEVVVTRALARRYWGAGPAVGQILRFAPGGPPFTVGGVTGDVRSTSLQASPDETVFLPLVTAPGPATRNDGESDARWTPRELAFVVRSSGAGPDVGTAVERIFAALAPALPVYGVRSMADVVSRSTARTSFTLALLEIASLAALLIGAVGRYGVVSYMVGLRERELAVRIALGARPAARGRRRDRRRGRCGELDPGAPRRRHEPCNGIEGGRMRVKALLLLAVAGTWVAPGRVEAAGVVRGHPRAVAVLAGGCYWGVESVFRHVRGVVSVTSGYSYPVAGAGVRSTARAESVRIVYDPARLSYHRILDVFFSVVQDPTELDRQGPDVGTDYRSIVFVSGDSGRAVVRAYEDSLTAAHVFPRPIVTEIDALRAFEPVVAEQQDFAAKHPDNPYIMDNDVPKLAALRQRFPGLYRG